MADRYPPWAIHAVSLRADTASVLAAEVREVVQIDALYLRAKAAGARVLVEPADHMYGERQCTLLDPWGHPWTLSETVFDSDPADWGGELLAE